MRDDLRHTLVLAFGTGVSSLFRIAYVIFVGRVLGPAEYADFYAALTVIMLFSTALAPVSGTVSRFTSLYLAEGNDRALASLLRFARREVLKLALAIFVVAISIGLVLRARLGWDSSAVPLIVALAISVTLLLDLPRGILRGALRFRPYSTNLIVESLLRLALAAAVVVPYTSATAALGAYLAAAALTLPLANRQAQPIGASGGNDDANAATIRSFAASLFVVAAIGAALQNADVLVVKALFADHESGIYSAAASLAKAIGLVFLPFGTLLLPRLTQHFSRGERLIAPLARTMGLFAVATALVVGVFARFGKRLVALLYGAEFEGAATLLVPLSVAMFFALLSVMVGQAFTATDHFRFVPIYAGSLLVVGAALWWGRANLQSVATALVGSQVVVFTSMLILFALSDSGAGRRSAP